jgi:hypothetical protein
MGEVKEHPLESWSNFDAWKAQIPDFKVKDRYKFAKHVRDNYPDKYVGGGLGLLMNLIYNLRGMENFFTDLYLEREKLDTLIDLIYETAYDQIDNYAAIGLDGVIARENELAQHLRRQHGTMVKAHIVAQYYCSYFIYISILKA